MATKDCKSLSELVAFCQGQSATVVDFYAIWCGPCKAIAPYLKQACQLNGVALATVNVDVARDAANQYKIKSMPTFFVLDKAGKPI